MLFRNLKSGNFVEAKDSDTVKLMSESPIYEVVKTAAPTPEAEMPVKKKGKKPKE